MGGTLHAIPVSRRMMAFETQGCRFVWACVSDWRIYLNVLPLAFFSAGERQGNLYRSTLITGIEMIICAIVSAETHLSRV